MPAPSLISPLPPLRLQLGENFSYEIPPYAFLEAGAPLAISASLSVVVLREDPNGSGSPRYQW